MSERINEEIKKLAIWTYIPEIMRLIEKNEIIAVISPKGFGNLIGLPAILGMRGMKTYIVVETKENAKSLSNYQKIISPGIEVGDEDEYNENTKIVYMTIKGIKDKILENVKEGEIGNIEFTDVIIIDDNDIKNIEHYMIKGILMDGYKNNRKIPKIIFDNSIYNQIEYTEINTYKINPMIYPINIQYNNKNYDINDRELYDDTIKIIKNYRNSEINGNILILVPDMNKVKYIEEKLKYENIIGIKDIINEDDIKKLTEKDDKNKIIICNNINENIITNNNIQIVIDTLVTKSYKITMSGGKRIVYQYISKLRSDQNITFLGRKMSGTYYRMCKKEFYENLVSIYLTEILKYPIYNEIMELINVGLDPKQILKDFINIDKDIELLKRLEMIENNKITKIGELSLILPFGIRINAILGHCIEKNIPLFPCISILTMIDSYGPTYFWYPYKNPKIENIDYNVMINEHYETFFKQFIGYSQLHTLSNIWIKLMEDNNGMDGTLDEIVEWARIHSINIDKIIEVREMVEYIILLLNHLGYKIEIGPFTTNGIIDVLRPIINYVYSDNIYQLQNNNIIRNIYYDSNLNSYTIDNYEIPNMLEMNPPISIVSLLSLKYYTKNDVVSRIVIGLDINPLNLMTSDNSSYQSSEIISLIS